MRALAPAAVAAALLPVPTAARADGGPFACMGCLGCGWFALAWLALSVALLVWVARDAKARGDSSALWLLLVFLIGPIGLLIYLLSRTKGELVPCPHCRNRRLASSTRCPHCGGS